MSLSREHVVPKILGKIKIYALTRAELLFPLYYEIPCTMIIGTLSQIVFVLKTPKRHFEIN